MPDLDDIEKQLRRPLFGRDEEEEEEEEDPPEPPADPDTALAEPLFRPPEPAGPPAPPRPETPRGSLGGDLTENLTAVGQGASMNFIDELAGLAMYARDPKLYGSLDEAQGVARVSTERAAGAHPLLHGLGQAVGGTAMSLAAPQSFWPQVATNAAQGALSEYGDTRDLARSALAGGANALAGAGGEALGWLTGKLGNLGRNTSRDVLSRYLGRGADAVADDVARGVDPIADRVPPIQSLDMPMPRGGADVPPASVSTYDEAMGAATPPPPAPPSRFPPPEQAGRAMPPELEERWVGEGRRFAETLRPMRPDLPPDLGEWPGRFGDADPASLRAYERAMGEPSRMRAKGGRFAPPPDPERVAIEDALPEAWAGVRPPEGPPIPGRLGNVDPPPYTDALPTPPPPRLSQPPVDMPEDALEGLLREPRAPGYQLGPPDLPPEGPSGRRSLWPLEPGAAPPPEPFPTTGYAKPAGPVQRYAKNAARFLMPYGSELAGYGIDAVAPALGRAFSREPSAAGRAIGRGAAELGYETFESMTGAFGSGRRAPAPAPEADLSYSLSSVLSSGDTGLSQADEADLTRAMVEGNPRTIAATDYRLRMKHPAYARRIERELRAIAEGD